MGRKLSAMATESVGPSEGGEDTKRLRREDAVGVALPCGCASECVGRHPSAEQRCYNYTN